MGFHLSRDGEDQGRLVSAKGGESNPGPEACADPASPPAGESTPSARHSKLKIVKAQAAAVAAGRARLSLVGLGFVLAFMILAGRLVTVMVLEADATAVQQIVKSPDYNIPRGDLVDRNGVLLASDQATHALFIHTRDVMDLDKTVTSIAGLFDDLSEEEVRRRLTSGRKRQIMRWDVSDSQRLALLAMGLPGLDFEPDVKRVYAQGTLAAHMVGYVNRAHKGKLGAERSLEGRIRAAADTEEATALSLDTRVQFHLERELVASKREFQARKAMGLVLQVHTGEIVALASLPSFDANRSLKIGDAIFANGITHDTYELGSVMKPLTIAMALDAGIAQPDTVYDASRPYRVGGFAIRDFRGKNRPLSVVEILQYSSNIGAAKMAHALGGDEQLLYLQRFGMTEPTPVDLVERGRPQMPSQWEITEQATVSFGHGLSVTPLHMASAIAALANGGYMVEPSLIPVKEDPRREDRRAVSPQTAKTVLAMMRYTILEGTGGKADVPGFPVAGKTGTAEKTSASGGYNRRSLLSSFIGVFPAHAPEYVVFVLLDEPVGTKDTLGYATGGWTAAPTVGRVVAKIAPLLAVRPVRQGQETALLDLDGLTPPPQAGRAQ